MAGPLPVDISSLVTDEEHPQVKTVGWFLDGTYCGNAEVIRVHQ